MRERLTLSSYFLFLLLCAFGCGDSQVLDTVWNGEDPVPPTLNEIKEEEQPPLKPNPQVKFHKAPKPLHPDAITNDWPSFLGPTHDAKSTETKLLKKWPEGGPSLVWEMETGTGYSSPAIQGEHLVYIHRLENEEIVECLHPESGEQYWSYSYPSQYQDRYGYNNGPRASPIIEGDRVYTYGAGGMLHCLHLPTGQIYWSRDLSTEFKLKQDFFGVTCTPLIEGNLLIINIGAPGGPCVGAFDKDTGKLIWGKGNEWGPSYGSPVPGVVHGQRRVMVFAGGDSSPPVGGLLVVNPVDGSIETRFPWRSQSYESVNAACPTVFENNVFVSASYEIGGALVKLLPEGGHEVLWETKELETHFNTTVYKDGFLYGFDGRNQADGSLVCLEAGTGKLMWRETRRWKETTVFRGKEQEAERGILRGTLLWADGHFLCLGELGHLLWLDLSPGGYNEISRAKLFEASETWCLPVLSHGLLYISQNTRSIDGTKPTRLLCYDLRGAE